MPQRDQFEVAVEMMSVPVSAAANADQTSKYDHLAVVIAIQPQVKPSRDFNEASMVLCQASANCWSQSDAVEELPVNASNIERRASTGAADRRSIPCPECRQAKYIQAESGKGTETIMRERLLGTATQCFGGIPELVCSQVVVPDPEIKLFTFRRARRNKGLEPNHEIDMLLDRFILLPLSFPNKDLFHLSQDCLSKSTACQSRHPRQSVSPSCIEASTPGNNSKPQHKRDL
jgi:hypothetical protein